MRGTFSAETGYRRLDLVVVNASSFVALQDDPGPCPGPGWQLVAGRGSRGAPGERGEQGGRGERGAPGQDAPSVVSWRIDERTYAAVPVMSDDTEGPPLELRGLFERFMEETAR